MSKRLRWGTVQKEVKQTLQLMISKFLKKNFPSGLSLQLGEKTKGCNGGNKHKTVHRRDEKGLAPL